MIKVLWGALLLLSSITQAQLADFGKVDFHRADSVAALYHKENLKSLPILAYQLTANLSTPLEKFRAIHTWVSTNIENDYEYFLWNKKRQEQFRRDSVGLANWNTTFRIKALKKLVREQSTVCTGYAYLLKELSSFAGIECKIINGYYRTPNVNLSEPGTVNHSWTAVNLNNKWYLCDATISSGSISLYEKKFIRNYTDGYFLAEPELFAKNHYPLDTDWLLMNDKPSLSEFLNAPLIYKSAFDYQIIPLTPKKMHLQTTKNDSISFLFKATYALPIDDIKIELSEGTNSFTIKPEITRNPEGFPELKCRFKSLGQYDLHIKIAENYLLTYTVKVKRNKVN